MAAERSRMERKRWWRKEEEVEWRRVGGGEGEKKKKRNEAGEKDNGVQPMKECAAHL